MGLPLRAALTRPLLGLMLVLPLAPLHAQIRGVLVDEPQVGQRAPGLILPYVTAQGVGNGAYELRLELGRVVVIGFCVQVADPGCAALWRQWQNPDSLYGKGVSVVGLTGDPLGVAAEFAAREGISGRLLADERGLVGRRWGVPGGGGDRVAIFVVSSEGVVAYRDLQFVPDDLHGRQRLESAVAAARRGSPPP